MGMDRSDRRRVRSVGTRDHDESLRDERWKGGYDDSKDKHRSKEKQRTERSSQREDKDHKSRDRERSKISDASKKRDKESKDVSRNQRKKDVNDREKDRTWDYNRTLKNKINAEGEPGVLSQQSVSELQDCVMRFIKEPGFEKKMLPQYDDPIGNEGVTLDERGNISGEAEKTLEELRRRIDDASVTPHFEDLTSTRKVSNDYYTSDEMLKFKKPKKKKSLRKKEKLDIDTLEAEARSAGLDSGDHGSRSDGKRQAQKEEHERSVAEKRNNAFQSAYMKADEETKALRMEPTVTVQKEEEEEEFVFGADDDDHHKSLQRARKLALKMKDGTPTGPYAIALLATSTSKNVDAENGDSQENQVVFTEMEEFVRGLQLDEEAHNPDAEDVAPATSEQEQNCKVGGWAEVKDVIHDVNMAEKEVKPDETIRESSLGKGLSGALRLLKDRGTLKDTVELGGRNMDKKKCKLLGIVNENDDKKEIRIERTDEYGRTLTPMEDYRRFSYKFHRIGPGKKKLEKRRRQHDEELKVKQMNNTDTPSHSSKRMREALSKKQTPCLVLSDHIKPGQAKHSSGRIENA